MTDMNDDEPVLVRRFLKTGEDGAETGESTWPAEADTPADRTEPPADDTILLPVVPAGAPRRDHRLLALVALAVAGALALGIVGYLILAPGDRAGQQPPSRADLPVPPGPSPTVATERARPPLSPTRRTKAPATRRSTPPPPPAETGAVPPGTPLIPPPADRTGAITAAGGRCLALGGVLALDGSPILTAACDSGPAQQFTLATDGTLRVAGRCAQITDDATVRSVGCDDRLGAQWRAGPEGSLMNPASGDCLVDPGGPGTVTRAAPCTGGDDQRWTLP